MTSPDPAPSPSQAPQGAAGPSRTMRHTIVWLVLGTALFMAFQAFLAQQERTRFVASDGVVTLKRAPDGHYHWPGSVNGVAVDFLVDTGATRTALPPDVADRAGLQKVGMSRSSTAGGDVVVTDVVADVTLQGGLQVQRLRVGVMPRLDTALLGMDVLGKLNVTQSQGEMRISSSSTSHKP